MKIARVHVRNLGPIDELELDFDRSMTVLFGDNGVGKSVVLRAVRELLARVVPRGGNEVSTASAEAPFTVPPPRPSPAGRERFGTALARLVRNPGEDSLVEIGFDDGNRLVGLFNPGGLKDGARAGVPGPALEECATSCVAAGFPLTVPFVGFLSDAGATGHFAHELLSDVASAAKASGQELREITDSVGQTFSTLFDREAGVTVGMDGKTPVLSVVGEGWALRFPDQLSRTEARMLALLWRIARVRLNAREKCGGGFVVLADDVERGLHPRQQALLCETLRAAFPEAQFILASHSPFLWYGLRRKSVLWLGRDDDGRVLRRRVDFALGGSVEDICANFFSLNCYSGEVSGDFRDVTYLLDQKRPDLARELIATLQEKYGPLPIFQEMLWDAEYLEESDSP